VQTAFAAGVRDDLLAYVLRGHDGHGERAGLVATLDQGHDFIFAT
jgi:hypothetical protein